MADIPDFAKLPSNAGTGNSNSNNGINTQQEQPRNDNVDAAPPNLPMWAVILIVVFLFALFVSLVCIYFYCKRRMKKKKLAKNRTILQSNVQPYSLSTQNPSIWDEGWGNGAYEDDGTMRSAYIPPGGDHKWLQNNLKTATAKSNRKKGSTKNINFLRNETETMKRKAPAPPPNPEQTYENVPVVALTVGRKAPPPPPVQSNQSDSKSLISSAVTASNIPAIMKETQYQLRNERKSSSHPATRSHEIDPVPSERDDETNATSFATQSEEERDASEDSTQIPSTEEETTVDNIDNGADPSFQGQTENNLIGILTQWKEHLFTQKNELQDYYNRLTGYVESVVIQPMDSVSNVGVDAHKDANAPDPNHRRRKSKRKRKRKLSYPVPPESMIDEMTRAPDDVEGQQEVIQDLKTRLTELEQLLKNEKEFEDEEQFASYQKSFPNSSFQRKTLQHQTTEQTKQPQQQWHRQHSQTKPVQASQAMPLRNQHQRTENPRRQSSSSSKKVLLQRNERITMQKLLAQLDKKDGEHLFKKITKLQQVAKQHANVMTQDGSKEQMTSQRLALQIHHVMRDVINPRLHTNLLLAAQAACNLSSKLAKALHSETKFENKEKAVNFCDRITGLVRHMLDMSKQLELRIESYYKEDFYRFIDAFILNAMKIMTASYGFAKTDEINQVKEERKPSRVQSVRSLKSPTTLDRSDVIQLSDGLTKLENLLKSGKFPGLDSSVPSSGYYPSRRDASLTQYEKENSSGSCDSDCDTYSYTSCSTCFPPSVALERNQRNPYLFPGDPIAKTLPNQSSKMSSDGFSNDPGNTRPSTRPNIRKRTSSKSCPKCQSPVNNAYLNPNLRPKSKYENALYQPKIIPDNNDPNHEVMLAKYLNELLKTQNKQSSLTLPHTLNVIGDAKDDKHVKRDVNQAKMSKTKPDKLAARPTTSDKQSKKEKESLKRNKKDSKSRKRVKQTRSKPSVSSTDRVVPKAGSSKEPENGAKSGLASVLVDNVDDNERSTQNTLNLGNSAVLDGETDKKSPKHEITVKETKNEGAFRENSRKENFEADDPTNLLSETTSNADKCPDSDTSVGETMLLSNMNTPPDVMDDADPPLSSQVEKPNMQLTNIPSPVDSKDELNFSGSINSSAEGDFHDPKDQPNQNHVTPCNNTRNDHSVPAETLKLDSDGSKDQTRIENVANNQAGDENDNDEALCIEDTSAPPESNAEVAEDPEKINNKPYNYIDDCDEREENSDPSDDEHKNVKNSMRKNDTRNENFDNAGNCKSIDDGKISNECDDSDVESDVDVDTHADSDASDVANDIETCIGDEVNADSKSEIDSNAEDADEEVCVSSDGDFDIEKRAKNETDGDDQVDACNDIDISANTNADFNVEDDFDDDSVPDVDEGSDAKSEVDVGSDAKSDMDVGSDAESDEDVGRETKSDVDVRSDAKSDMDVGSDAKSDVDVGSDAESDVNVESDAEIDVDVGSDAKSDVDDSDYDIENMLNSFKELSDEAEKSTKNNLHGIETGIKSPGSEKSNDLDDENDPESICQDQGEDSEQNGELGNTESDSSANFHLLDPGNQSEES